MDSKYVDKRLMKLSKSNGKFVKLEVGDSFTGTYLTWRAEMDEKYQKMKPVYLFKNENGEEKQLGTGAKKFGSKMACVIPGSLVQITRLGEGQKTDYTVKVLKAATMPKDVDEDEDEEEVVAPKKKAAVVEEDDDEEEGEEEELFA